jgi:hypothetical protein
MIVELLNQFHPDPDELLREISRDTTDEMLNGIASVDYEGRGREQHLVALRQIRDTGTFPLKMYWYPAEVLELFRWSDSGNPISQEDSAAGHRMRIFCCAALLRATREPYNYGDGIGTDSSLIRLIQSLRSLRADFNLPAVRFISWLLLQIGPDSNDEQICPYAIGLLWFALELVPPMPEQTLTALAQWIVQRAKGLSTEDKPWLPIMVNVSQSSSAWKLFGAELFDRNMDGRAPQLQEALKWIGLGLTA